MSYPVNPLPPISRVSDVPHVPDVPHLSDVPQQSQLLYAYPIPIRYTTTEFKQMLERKKADEYPSRFTSELKQNLKGVFGSNFN